MRKMHKKQVEAFLKTLGQSHEELGRLIDNGDKETACRILEDCQQGVILLGGSIEQSEGASAAAIPLLEQYCELAFLAYGHIARQETDGAKKALEQLNACLANVEDCVTAISVRYEIVFLPYKASMWDSLESVWMAADADPACDAYVVPIPYYDKHPDGSFGAFHYEGDDFPADVPVTHYKEYCLEEREPDAVYIHNPYDDANYVTSIDPRFYAKRLKKHTGCLVYIPYYATTGGMNESRGNCPVYSDTDYIVMQSEKFRIFFDRAIPREKLVALGSPKFDRVIRLCNEKKQPPQEWKQLMEGRTVYFYNTSINEMLEHTGRFLKKMEYVFQCFRERTDACLVWRPHPLLETTFDSLRKQMRPAYDRLKTYFLEHKIGIYDDTPDITQTIALCDVYIGEFKSSVRSMFGIAGKPIYIMENRICTKPGPNDWRGEVIKPFWPQDGGEWMVTQQDKLYYAPGKDYHYKYICDLTEYANGNYYLKAIHIGNKTYVCPSSAQDIVVVADGKIEKRISLKPEPDRKGEFEDAWRIGRYLFLIPQKYAAVVRYDTQKDEVLYIQDYKDVFANNFQGQWKVGGSCVWNNYVMIASPTQPYVVAIDSESGKAQVLEAGEDSDQGYMMLVPDPDGASIWLLPYIGTEVIRWEPIGGKTRRYSGVPAGFQCKNRMNGYATKERPFARPAFYKNYVIFPPYWGNMFLRLDKETGIFEEWKPPVEITGEEKNGYFSASYISAFIGGTGTAQTCSERLFDYPGRRLYEINLETNAYQEIAIHFDQEELARHVPGFCELSKRMGYGCQETYFNPLERFLDGIVTGNAYDKAKQLEIFQKIAANSDGTSGLEIHRFIKGKLGRRQS